MPLLNEGSRLFLGSQPVQAVYLGSEKVWPTAAPDYSVLISAQAVNGLSIGSDGKLFAGPAPSVVLGTFVESEPDNPIWDFVECERVVVSITEKTGTGVYAFYLAYGVENYVDGLESTASIVSESPWFSLANEEGGSGRTVALTGSLHTLYCKVDYESLPVGTYTSRIALTYHGRTVQEVDCEITVEPYSGASLEYHHFTNLGKPAFTIDGTLVTSASWDGSNICLDFPAISTAAETTVSMNASGPYPGGPGHESTVGIQSYIEWNSTTGTGDEDYPLTIVLYWDDEGEQTTVGTGTGWGWTPVIHPGAGHFEDWNSWQDITTTGAALSGPLGTGTWKIYIVLVGAIPAGRVCINTETSKFRHIVEFESSVEYIPKAGAAKMALPGGVKRAVGPAAPTTGVDGGSRMARLRRAIAGRTMPEPSDLAHLARTMNMSMEEVRRELRSQFPGITEDRVGDE